MNEIEPLSGALATLLHASARELLAAGAGRPVPPAITHALVCLMHCCCCCRSLPLSRAITTTTALTRVPRRVGRGSTSTWRGIARPTTTCGWRAARASTWSFACTMCLLCCATILTHTHSLSNMNRLHFWSTSLTKATTDVRLALCAASRCSLMHSST